MSTQTLTPSGRIATAVIGLASGLAWIFSGEAGGSLMQLLHVNFGMALPAFAVLTLQSPRNRRWWAALIGFAALMALLAVQTSAAGVVGWGFSPRFNGAETARYALALMGLTLIASSYAACWVEGEGYAYPKLFMNAWRSGVIAFQAQLYVGVLWLLLFLGAGLFDLLGLQWPMELLKQKEIARPIIGLALGVSVAIARSQGAMESGILRRVLAGCRSLLPVVAVIAIGFALALLAQGLEPLWQTRNATPLLLTLNFALVLFINTAFGDGSHAAPGRWQQWLVKAAVLLMPVFAGIAAYALSLRIGQYGLSLDRLWAAIMVGISALYAVGYSVAALRRSGSWMAPIAPLNRALALLTAVIAVAVYSQLLNLPAIAAAHIAAKAQPKEEDLVYLHRELGHAGRKALLTLQARGDAATRDKIATLLADKKFESPQPTVLGQSAAGLLRSPPDVVLPPTLLMALDANNHPDFHCTQQEPCWLVPVELSQAPPQEWLVVGHYSPHTLGGSHSIIAILMQQADSHEGWRSRRNQYLHFDNAEWESMRNALATGAATPIMPRIADVQLGSVALRWD